MNLLFDLDGTLTDPLLGITKCISHALDKLDMQSPPKESLRWCIGPPLKNSLAKLLASDDNTLVEKALVFYRERFGTVGLFENEVYEGIPEVLEGLQENGHITDVQYRKSGRKGGKVKPKRPTEKQTGQAYTFDKLMLV
jgi:phosphoglycolate phosphatase